MFLSPHSSPGVKKRCPVLVTVQSVAESHLMIPSALACMLWLAGTLLAVLSLCFVLFLLGLLALCS